MRTYQKLFSLIIFFSLQLYILPSDVSAALPSRCSSNSAYRTAQIQIFVNGSIDPISPSQFEGTKFSENAPENSIRVTINNLPKVNYRVSIGEQYEANITWESSPYSNSGSIDYTFTDSDAYSMAGIGSTANKALMIIREGGVGFDNDCLISLYSIVLNYKCDISITPVCTDPNNPITVTITNAKWAGQENYTSPVDVYLGPIGHATIAKQVKITNGTLTTTLENLPEGQHQIALFNPNAGIIDLEAGTDIWCVSGTKIDVFPEISICTGITPTIMPTPGNPGTSIITRPYDPCSGLDVDGSGYEACQRCMNPDDPNAIKGTYTALGCISNNPTDFATQFIRVLFSIAGGVAFLLILFGSFLCITSQGNPEKTQVCKQTITAAIVGILLLVFSLFIISVIFGPLGILPGLIEFF